MNQKKGKGLIISIVLIVLLIVSLFFSVYTIQEDEYAMLTTFGNVRVEDTPGIKFKIPYVQHVTKVSKASKSFTIGYRAPEEEEKGFFDKLKFDKDNDGPAKLIIPNGGSVYKESFMITSDYNFVNVDFYFEYLISDPVKYFYASESPEVIVKNLAQSYIRDTVGSHTVDEVLTTGKYEIQTEIKNKLQSRLDKEDIGIQITNAVIQDAEVPTQEVYQAFKRVEDAKQGMETAINNANAFANTKIPEANAQVDKIIKDAQAKKEALIADAEGQTSRFNSLYSEYAKFPLITKERMFYEAMEDVLPNMKIYITDGNTKSILPLDKFN